MKHRRKIWTAAGICLAAASFLVTAHYRARSATNTLREQLRAQGEKLSIPELIPPPREGADGSAAFLNAASWLSTIADDLLPNTMAMTRPGRARVTFSLEVLPTSNCTNAWPELGTRLEELRSNIEELNAQLSNPVFHFPINYSQSFPLRPLHVQTLRSSSHRLAAETLFRLHQDQPDEALKALVSTVRIPACLQEESLLMSQLIRHACTTIAVAATWEALQYPGWNDAQLATLQSTWESSPSLPGVVSTLCLERAWVLGEFENCRESSRRFDNIGGGTGPASSPLDDLSDIGTQAMGDPQAGLDALLDRFPRRWVWPWWTGYSDEIWYLNWAQVHLHSARSLESGAPYLQIAARNEVETARLGEPSKTFLLSRFAARGIYSALLRRAATAEAQRRIVIAAIAIRRYSDQHGKLPSDLAALAPDFVAAVPLDPMDGQPLRYQLTADVEFILYSIGFDGKDDNGDPKPQPPSAKTFHWVRGEDWVWPMPATAKDVAKYHEELDSRRRRSRK